jgi:hypothetical protein
MNTLGQTLFLPEKLNHNTLLELSHLMLKDATNGSKWVKSRTKETRGSQEYE